MREDYVEAVLEVANLIPVGTVLSYGDIAVLLETGGPRQVGSVLSSHGDGAPWWRVIRANGSPPLCHDETALEHYREERTTLKISAGHRTTGAERNWRVDMSSARWKPTESELDVLDIVRDRLILGMARPDLHGIFGTERAVPEMSAPHDEVDS
ncbi:MGMT family protein [Paenarthrobacter sp. Z7-10]|uniref:MGMT family protein n=1 Tax=Paenarthrobacter sp. Z7-10 TaxID=2787635 RepID=UPI0022A9B269|nr:MGMT family protein [Paenarthrobacter sp. Z7-10]MCZ2403205.1 MGMT family protein [Paenarthrobacter sp. Z7-10]